ncbi:hypothetical protein DY000_02026127 [Brassica cretica]|uniref:DUF4005 domain-containing protein n=1 Tax=Brassica cretica TaxID=69181 RepID=A0ABQ7EAD4_BRACR|nr:hypothetical protein DY000_02026127 [Brassica cretica]
MTISPTRHSDPLTQQRQRTPGSNSSERIPIASRLGPVSTEPRVEEVEGSPDPGSQRDRIPAKDRIGKALASPKSVAAGKKWKPGRPLGPRKVVSSPVPNLPSGSRKRKLHVEKPPTGRKKQNSEGEMPRKNVKQSKQKGKNIRKGSSEEGRRVPSARRSPPPQEASANSHHKTQPYERGIPLPMSSTNLPIVAVENAVGVIRETLSQYTACADPSESATRRERVRLAEAQGTIEGNAIHLAKINEERMLAEEVNGGDKGSGSKIPVLSRLGSLAQENELLDNRNSTGTSGPKTRSQDRAHIRERLGPYLPEMTL